MAVAGRFKMSNPCFQFRILHNHATDLRRNQNEAMANVEHGISCCPTHNVSGRCLQKKHCFIQDPQPETDSSGGGFFLFLLGSVVVALWYRYRKRFSLSLHK